MKSTYGILWYFFIIYATSVIVNFSHYHKTFIDDTNESAILSAVRCLVQGKSDAIEDDSCKLSFQYNKEMMMNLLKSLLSKKEFNKFFKLTLKNGSKKGTSDLVNITLDLKPLFSETNSSNSVHLGYWYTFYVFISILLITFITPLWPLTNYIYIITLTSLFMFSITIYLQILKLIVFSIVYLITFKQYKFWLLPNLNRDVGLLSTFWPLYELDTLLDARQTVDQLDDKIEYDQNVNIENELDEINLNQINTEQSTIDNQLQKLIDKQTSCKSECDTLVNNSSQSPDSLESICTQVKQSCNQFVEFLGNDHLPMITTTPPPKFNTVNRRARLEIIDLDDEQEVDDKIDRKVNIVEGRQRFESGDDCASITPAISCLDVNKVERTQNSARKRIASNRSDDGFEILNNDFLRNNSLTKDEIFVCSKRNS